MPNRHYIGASVFRADFTRMKIGSLAEQSAQLPTKKNPPKLKEISLKNTLILNSVFTASQARLSLRRHRQLLSIRGLEEVRQASIPSFPF